MSHVFRDDLCTIIEHDLTPAQVAKVRGILKEAISRAWDHADDEIRDLGILANIGALHRYTEEPT